MKNAGKPRKVHEEGSANCLSVSDAELMDLIRAGQQEAFAALVRRHQQPLLNFFVRLGADIHGAEDCAQEALLRLYRYRDRYAPSAPFTAFLYTLARHAWIDWSRSRARRPALPLERAAAMGAERPADDRLDLRAALVALPERLRMVLVLSVDQGLNLAEIAAVLEIPAGTVKSRMFHAVRRLREVLNAPARV